VLLLSLPCGIASGASASTPEAVKAAFLYHFGNYVEWPTEDAAGDPEDQVVIIGVLGSRDVLAELRTILVGKTVRDRPVRARAVVNTADLEGVQILYIGEQDPRVVSDWIYRARNRSILVITDVFDGIAQGAMINFLMDRNRVRFEISRTAAEQAGLKLSSRLLAVAVRVHSSRLNFELDPPAWG
jgi:hypothetical protein